MTFNIILSTDADIGRGLRMLVRIKTLRMRILLCSSAQGSTNNMHAFVQLSLKYQRVHFASYQQLLGIRDVIMDNNGLSTVL
jgi:hypothetical protein